MLRSIDKTTGLPTGSVPLSGYPSDENINSLTFDGVALFGVTNGSHDLIRIDSGTGAITTIGTAAPGFCTPAVDGIAFLLVGIPAPAASISAPAASTVGLLTLAAALAAAGGLLLRRRIVR